MQSDQKAFSGVAQPARWIIPQSASRSFLQLCSNARAELLYSSESKFPSHISAISPLGVTNQNQRGVVKGYTPILGRLNCQDVFYSSFMRNDRGHDDGNNNTHTVVSVEAGERKKLQTSLALKLIHIHARTHDYSPEQIYKWWWSCGGVLISSVVLFAPDAPTHQPEIWKHSFFTTRAIDFFRLCSATNTLWLRNWKRAPTKGKQRDERVNEERGKSILIFLLNQ